MRKRRVVLAAAAAVLAACAVPGAAWAYFTTYTEASGGYALSLEKETTVREDFSSWTKRVSISAEEGADAVYVRVKAFCGSGYSLAYSDEGGKWQLGEDGYYYYSAVLNGGETADELQIQIRDVPQDADDPADFNVVVVYETTLALYGADGSPYADWTQVLDDGQL